MGIIIMDESITLSTAFQLVLTAILITITYLSSRNSRRSVIFTKVDHLSRLYDRKCDILRSYFSAAISCKGSERQQYISLMKKEEKLNKEILNLYFEAVDEYDKEFNLNGKFSHAIRNTYEQNENDSVQLENLLNK
jgi:hypothetical protein